MSVDVVIPTYRPDGRFQELLKRLGRQNHPIRHIYVINTRSDRFPEEVEDMPGVIVTHITPEEFDHGATRDRGFHMSNADIVVFMTQDAIPANDSLIEELLLPLKSGDKVGVSYARQLTRRDCGVIERYTRQFNYPEQSQVKGEEDIPRLGIKTFFCSNVCAAYRRDVYEKIGGFCRKAIFNEDMIFAGRMILSGYQVAYAAKAQVIHSHNYTGIQQFRRNFDLGVSQAEHPEVFKTVRSETEGARLVKGTMVYLLKCGKPYLIPSLLYKSGCKYLGYKLGYTYRKLPIWFVRRCSMSKTYWEKCRKP